MIKDITEASFEAEVINQAGLVLVDFWAPRCAPCKVMMPWLEQLASQYQGRLTIRKLNIDEHLAMRETHNVSGVPTLVLFRDGVECDRQRGMRDRSRIVDFLLPHVEGAGANTVRDS
jgi:thioredoxin 1